MVAATLLSALFAVSDPFSPGPLTAPLNLRVSDIESNQVTVHWDPVSRNSIMGELKEYKVCMIVYSVIDKGYCLDIICMFIGGPI